MAVTFWKMHGAGNDFILIDDRQNKFPDKNKALIKKICQRRTGIGCEGLILIRPSTIADCATQSVAQTKSAPISERRINAQKASSQKLFENSVADFRMRFFNPNGNEADMCGNGARCVARLAYDLNIANATMKFETRAGIIKAEVKHGSVKLYLPPATNYQKEQNLTIPSGAEIYYDFINTGVPHAVVQTNNLNSYPVKDYGHAIIKHSAFAPEETNVNFAEIIDPHHINIRTYERGVEDETLACGTGITATAITMALRNLVLPPVSIKAASSDILVVDFTIENNKTTNITLTGPATHVFTGEIEIDSTNK